jgi:hypothetical protein
MWEISREKVERMHNMIFGVFLFEIFLFVG